MTLSILWFILVAVLWTVYLILEGFDFGVGMLLPFVAKGDRERTQAVRTIGPHWDGNEVWLLTAGGATFAAFPEWYATMFSGMYLALFLVLAALIVRVMALEWRSKVATEKWRFTWDWAHTISAWLVPLLLGVAFANFVQGMKIEVIDVATGTVVDPTLVDQSLSSATHQLTGGFFSLLTPFTILGGLAVLVVCLAHGAQFLALKTTGDVRDRANAIAAPASIAATVLAAAWLMWGQFSYTTNVLAWIPLVVAALAIIASTVLSQATLRREGLSLRGLRRGDCRHGGVGLRFDGSRRPEVLDQPGVLADDRSGFVDDRDAHRHDDRDRLLAPHRPGIRHLVLLDLPFPRGHGGRHHQDGSPHEEDPPGRELPRRLIHPARCARSSMRGRAQSYARHGRGRGLSTHDVAFWGTIVPVRPFDPACCVTPVRPAFPSP